MNIEEKLKELGEQIADFEKLEREYVSTKILISITKRLYEVIDNLYKNPIERLNFQGTMQQKIQEKINNYNPDSNNKIDELQNLVQQSIGLLARGYDNLAFEIANVKIGNYDKPS